MKPTIRPGAPHRRGYPMTLELRDAGDGTMPHIVGHAAVYNSWSQDLGGFKERVLPGAFAKSLGVSDVRALFNHDPNFLLGRTKSGTLTLSDEAKGLHIDALPPDTQTIRDLVLEPMRRGDVDQMSFSFIVRGDELWDREPTAGTGAVWRSPKQAGGLYERDLLDLELFDVSPVTFPAYTRTDVAVRALLAENGLDLEALTDLLVRGSRGLPLTAGDRDLLTASIAHLRTYLPDANGEEPSGPNGEEPSRPDAGIDPRRARLLQELEHRRRLYRVAA